jgi:hypothetical protein
MNTIRYISNINQPPKYIHKNGNIKINKSHLKIIHKYIL